MSYFPRRLLKVVTNEKGEASGAVLNIKCWWGTWCWMFLSFHWLPSSMKSKAKRIIFTAYNSQRCECHAAPTILVSSGQVAPTNTMRRVAENARKYPFVNI
jgi:hypothetical protein